MSLVRQASRLTNILKNISNKILQIFRKYFRNITGRTAPLPNISSRGGRSFHKTRRTSWSRTCDLIMNYHNINIWMITHLQLNYKLQMKNPLKIPITQSQQITKRSPGSSNDKITSYYLIIAEPCQTLPEAQTAAQSLKKFLHIDQNPQQIWSAPIVWLQNCDFINFCWVGVIVWAPGAPWSVQWGRPKPKQWPKLIFVKFGAPPHYLGL